MVLGQSYVLINVLIILVTFSVVLLGNANITLYLLKLSVNTRMYLFPSSDARNGPKKSNATVRFTQQIIYSSRLASSVGRASSMMQS